MTGKSVVVTGASPGSIGYFTAVTLARWGADTIVTARRRCEAMAGLLRDDLGRAAGPGSITPYALDLANAASVEAFAEWFSRRRDGLHVLVNNAGVLLDVFSEWDAPRRTGDGFEFHWRTNFLGTFHLTSLLLPLLLDAGRRGCEPRVVNVSSRQHFRGRNEWLFGAPPRYSSWAAYGQSKLALVHHSFELQRRYGADFGVRSMALHPGSGYTNMISQGIRRSRAFGRLRRVLEPLASMVLMSANECAQTIVHCASHPDAKGGLYYERCAPSDPSADALDATVSRRLWEATERAVKTWR